MYFVEIGLEDAVARDRWQFDGLGIFFGSGFFCGDKGGIIVFVLPYTILCVVLDLDRFGAIGGLPVIGGVERSVRCFGFKERRGGCSCLCREGRCCCGR